MAGGAPTLLILALLAAPLASTEPQPLERPDSLKTYVGVDYFFANSRDLESPAPHLRIHELGMSGRLRLRRGDFGLRLDYRGREPVAGELSGVSSNGQRSLRLLLEAQGIYGRPEDRVSAGLGRFVAPAAVFLPVDGAWAQLHLANELFLRVSAGRRAISTSRRNLPFGVFYPAVTLAARWTSQRMGIRAVAGYADDEAVQLAATTNQRQRFGAGHARLSVWARPLDRLHLDGGGSFVQQATYTVGPTWVEAPIEVQAIGLGQARAAARWRATDGLRVRYDFLYQRPHLTRFADDASVVDPTFMDHRAGTEVRLGRFGWVRADYRLRLREERVENRYRVRVDLHRIGGGLLVRGMAAYDDINARVGPDPDNRFVWLASVGYRTSDLEVEAGASFVERTGSVSGRQMDNDAGADLSPFALQAEKIVFARAFYTLESIFVGFDLERNLNEGEFRVFLQVGSFWETDG